MDNIWWLPLSHHLVLHFPLNSENWTSFWRKKNDKKTINIVESMNNVKGSLCLGSMAGVNQIKIFA